MLEMPKREHYSDYIKFWEDMEKYFADRKQQTEQTKKQVLKYVDHLNNKSPFEIGLVYTRFEEDIEQNNEFWIFEDRGNFHINHKCIKLSDINLPA